MAELQHRNKLEEDLARELARLGGKQLPVLVRELGEPPSLSNISDEFWREYGAGLTSALNTWLMKVYLQQAEEMLNQTSAGIDWALVNKDAAAWASRYTFDLVKDVTEHTRDSLQSIISGAITNSLPLEQVRAQIEPLFGPVRAESIATTELTRAASQAEAETVARLKEQDVKMVPTWYTRDDEKVCPVCGGLYEQVGELVNGEWQFTHPDTNDVYGLPPAHPRCRCSPAWNIDNG